jgi:uncharacterized membrane protein (GlpM family)
VDLRTIPLYFFLGGTVVALVTYFGSTARGLIAAFIAFFPSISLITFTTIYLKGGIPAAADYARSMLVLTPAWLLYVLAVLFLLPRWGLFPSLLAGVLTYVAAAFVTIRLQGMI